MSNGRSRTSHGLAAAPGHGQVALGTNNLARPWGPGVVAPRNFVGTQRYLPMAHGLPPPGHGISENAH